MLRIFFAHPSSSCAPVGRHTKISPRLGESFGRTALNGPSIVMVSVAIPPSTLEIKLEERGGEYSGLTPSCIELLVANATPTSLVPAFAGKRTRRASSADRPYADVERVAVPSTMHLGSFDPTHSPPISNSFTRTASSRTSICLRFSLPRLSGPP